jgi:sugar phosphate isomerase/epimerase
MAPSIAVQLYTVRDLLPKDFAGTVTRIAQIGYAGVETGGFQGVSAQEAARLFADLGLKVPSIHAALPLGEQEKPTVELAQSLGVRRVVASTPRDAFASAEKVRALCETWNQAQPVAARHGLELHLHNHWWEFTPVGERNGLDLLLEYLDPKIGIQVDTYWAQTGGYDPAAAVKKVGTRAPLLHIKDGPCDKPESPMVAVGQGVVDFRAVMQAAGTHAEWLIVELDRCATDMMAAVEQSYQYLAGQGFGRGRQ